jgi:hypothetical protein
MLVVAGAEVVGNYHGEGMGDWQIANLESRHVGRGNATGSDQQDQQCAKAQQ